MAAFHELSDGLHPMTVKELQQSMRRASFVFPFLGIQLLAVASMAVEFSLLNVHRTDLPGILNLHMVMESGPFWNVVMIVCGVIMPLGGLILMGQELEEGNHELLLLTRLNRWAVVKGKFFILWAVSSLSFISLLPYVVVRYFIGGVELWQELMCSLSVIALAAVVSAGAIGASSFKNIAARIGVFALFLCSFAACAGMVLAASAGISRGDGFDFHLFFNLNGVVAALAYTVLGLTMARSRLRLVVHAYEVKPSWLVIGLLFFTPFITGMTTAMTIGYAGFVGLVAMMLVAIYTDVTPKLRAKLPMPTTTFSTGIPMPPQAAGMVAPPPLVVPRPPELAAPVAQDNDEK